jgi:peptide chain release factor subunit 1
MSEDFNELVKELSDLYDPDSMDTFVTLYLHRESNNKFIERRVKACKTVLKNEELKNFIATIDKISTIIKKNIGKNIAVFASDKHNYFRYTNLPVKVENLLIVDSSPYLRPLARILDEWDSFTLVLVNSNYAKIFSVSLGKIESTKSLSADIMNKHKKGGWSQARFNRLRKGAINEFLSEVVDALQKRADDHIIIAGPGQAKKQLRDMLPKNLQERLVQLVDIDIDDEKELLKESITLISEDEKQRSHDAVQRLKEEILKDGLAAYGVEETLKAVKNGQVELLIIEKNLRIAGWICENCQVVNTGNKKNCPYCSKKTSEVDVLE